MVATLRAGLAAVVVTPVGCLSASVALPPHNHAAPVRDRQLKSYRAAYGVSSVTTGPAGVPKLCSQGTLPTDVVARAPPSGIVAPISFFFLIIRPPPSSPLFPSPPLFQ